MYQQPGYVNMGYGQPNAIPYGTPPTSGPVAPQTGGAKLQVDENAAITLLKHLEKRELQGLLENDSKLQDLVNDLAQVKNIQVERETLLASNKSIAEYNLLFQPQLESLKGKVASDHEEAKRLHGVIEEDRAQLLLSSNQQSVDTLLALLQTEYAKTEESSEQLAEEFCDKKMKVDSFVEKFIEIRTLAHLRRVKSDKMAELIQNQSRRPVASSMPNVPAGPASEQNGNPWFNNNNAVPAPAQTRAPYPAANAYMMMPEPFLPR